MTQKQRGGFRQNAGRKKSSFESKVLSFYVRKEWEIEIKELVRNYIKLKKEKNEMGTPS